MGNWVDFLVKFKFKKDDCLLGKINFGKESKLCKVIYDDCYIYLMMININQNG